MFCIPHVLNPYPGRPSGEEVVWQVEQICQSKTCVINANADTNADKAK